jgi:hypothetical protein
MDQKRRQLLLKTLRGNNFRALKAIAELRTSADPIVTTVAQAAALDEQREFQARCLGSMFI